MECLWTPWRMAYVGGSGDAEATESSEGAAPDEPGLESAVYEEESTGCVFCDKIRQPASRDRHSLVLFRGEHNFVILNLYPYNSGHLMVVPYEHTADFARLDRETSEEMVALAQRMVRAISAEYKPEGHNLGMNLGRVAGAGVADHLHMHVVPRWAGDTNFMPIVGATKVMPELLETTYDRLKRRLERPG